MMSQITALLLFIMVLPLWGAGNLITNVSYSESATEISVEIHFQNQSIQYDSYIRESPQRLVIEAYNTTSLIKEGHTIVTLYPMIGCRLTAKDGTMEIIIEFEELPIYTISQEAKKVVTRWTKIPRGDIKALAASQNVQRSPGGKQYMLKGIVWRDGKAMVLINEDVYYIGDRIGDYEVKEISEKTVQLRKGYDILTLHIEE